MRFWRRTGRHVSHLIPTYGLSALFLAVMLESAGMPVPGETALIAASVLAAQGLLSALGDRDRRRGGDHRRQRGVLDRPRGGAAASRALATNRSVRQQDAPTRRTLLCPPRWQGRLPCPLHPWPSSDRCAGRGHRRHGVVALSLVECGGRWWVGDQRRGRCVWPWGGCGARPRPGRLYPRGGGDFCRCVAL